MMSGGQVEVQEMDSAQTKKEEIFIGAEETEGSRDPYAHFLTAQRRLKAGPMEPSAGPMVLREENICLNILRHLDSFEAIRGVAILNHRTYNIYKTNEEAILRNLVVVGRRETMLRLTNDQSDKDEKDCPSSQCLVERMCLEGVNSGDSEGASIRAIKHADSDCGSSDSEGDWDFEGQTGGRSRCESLDITEGLGISSAMGPGGKIGGGVMSAVGDGDGEDKTGNVRKERGKDSTPLPESPVVIKSPSSSSWLDDDGAGPDPPEYVHHRGRGSSFYSITEQEAYRILFPPEEGGASVPRERERNSFGVVVDGGGYFLGCGEDDRVRCADLGEGEDPGINLKYSRDEGWFKLLPGQGQHEQGQHRGGVAEGKSLALMGAGNGNNKLLREEFEKRVGFVL